ncbi:LEA type 2 family protein [Luteimonas sp. MC1572]|uniref:NDR1/HIN1-like protein n=1 Tax=Luteimonas sp. MC1572 TaxID=2799325 RepID=UPI0018F0A8C6|nr:LEA type 2 family protein [Luteimonas sp. MC1572]MBJ6981110.1 LEA type 2 family protein [Luteimonas sp. MC1572]QQO02444.1 LEA type 2 family protein [Luteimonas sp. MC1572]
MVHRVLVTLALACVLLTACSGGPVRRVSEPAASIQQLTVAADGNWSLDLRLQNYSSVPMRFDTVTLDVRIGDQAAGQLLHQPALTIGPESADVVTIKMRPDAGARMFLADALASRRGVDYALEGSIDAAPADRGSSRSYRILRKSALSPMPGLPGVLR